MIRIGLNLMLWTTHVDESYAPIFQALADTGYDGVEVPIFEGDEVHYRHLGRMIRDHGLAVTASSAIPDQTCSPISPEPQHRQAATDFLRGLVDRAAALGSDIVVGPLYQKLAEFTGSGPTETEKAWAVEVHRAVAPHAAEQGVTVLLEYLNRFECHLLNTMADAADFVAQVGHPNVGAMYDTFHANIEEQDLGDSVARHVGQIAHVHVAENDRGTPGKGHIDFATIFRALRQGGYDGWLTIESFSGGLPGLSEATRVWRDFFPNREEVYRKGLPFIREQWAQAAS